MDALGGVDRQHGNAGAFAPNSDYNFSCYPYYGLPSIQTPDKRSQLGALKVNI